MTEYYLLYIWNDIEPELLGPFPTEIERYEKAQEIRAEDVEKRHGLFPLDCVDGKPAVYDFCGDFSLSEEEEDDGS